MERLLEWSNGWSGDIMRLTVTFEHPNLVSIPINYNYFLSSLIYENLPESADRIHGNGFQYEKRKFKLFTFSRLGGTYVMKDRNMVFTGNVSFTFSTAVDGIAEEFAKSMVAKESVRIGSVELKTSSIYVHKEPELSDRVFIRTLSPITVYSTLLTKDGKKKTYYYSPYEKEFSSLVDANLRKKYFALGKKASDSTPLQIVPMGRQREVIADFKGTVVKGWMGTYELKGEPELVKLAYDAGIGAKNSEGFGCFEILEVKPDAA